jgi:hypothetical protein
VAEVGIVQLGVMAALLHEAVVVAFFDDLAFAIVPAIGPNKIAGPTAKNSSRDRAVAEPVVCQDQ